MGSSSERQSSPRKTKKSSKKKEHRKGNSSSSYVVTDDENPDLVELEERLTDEVDEDFFQDPRKFHTLNRIIDVLGMQLTLAEDASYSKRRKQRRNSLKAGKSSKKEAPRIDRNPAYKALVAQRDVVEEAIEHLALIHCADLNGSVVQVGRVARQFHDAVSQVQSLRKQVKDIQETLGTGSNRNSITFNSAGIAVNASGKPIDGKDRAAREAARAAASSAMSLRELWLKKLEAEAVLTLLDKLDTIRAAPMKFDDLLRQHRIGAAVLTVSNGLDTMFMSDVNQVQALHKIMEQLMIRKQKAEEVVWDLLSDVLFLRTGNGTAQLVALGAGAGEALFNSIDKSKGRHPRRIAANTSASVDSNSMQQDSTDGGSSDPNNKNSIVDGTNSIVANSSLASVVPGKQQLSQQQASSNPSKNPLAAASYLWNLPPSGWDYIRRQQMGMVNPFLTVRMRFALDPDDLQLESILRNIEAQQRERERGRLSNGVDEDFYDDEEEESSLFGPSRSIAPAGDEKKQGDAPGADDSTKTNSRREAVIPSTMMDAEFDLEADERRSLEEQQYDSQGRRRKQALHMTKPTYLDHVLALRTLVECLVRLRRLDDVERIVTEQLERELSQLVQREQARTFLWVEKSSTDRLRKGAGGRYAALLNKAGSGIDLRDFRQHLNHILSAFGNVQIRLIHLTQIIRHRIVSIQL
jgi:hypothetical protein